MNAKSPFLRNTSKFTFWSSILCILKLKVSRWSSLNHEVILFGLSYSLYEWTYANYNVCTSKFLTEFQIKNEKSNNTIRWNWFYRITITFRSGSSFRLTAMRVQRSHRKITWISCLKTEKWVLSFCLLKVSFHLVWSKKNKKNM